MQADLRQLERDIERKIAVLAQLPAREPSALCISRVKDAMTAEANALRRRRRQRAWLRYAGVAAAIVLFAALWRMPLRTDAPYAEHDPDQFVETWLAAADESSAALAALVDAPWLVDSEDEVSHEAAIDDFIESIDRSLGSLDGEV